MEYEQAESRGASEAERSHEASSERPIANSSPCLDATEAASNATGPIHPRCSLTMRTSRRTLLRVLGAAAVADLGEVLALSLSAVSCAARAPNAIPTKGSAPTGTPSSDSASNGGTGGNPNNIGNTKQIPPDSAISFDAVADNGPGVLIHLHEGSFVAYDTVCIHEGCTVAYNPRSQHLECPCHGSVFDPANAGQVLADPARLPLAMIKIAIDNSTGAIMQD